MNCVNCGAPPRLGVDACLYCQVDIGKRISEADHKAFERALKAFKDCDWDSGRETQAKMLSTRGTVLTAGQARRLAATCDWDAGKLTVLDYLYPNVISPVNLLECSDIFDWDAGRDALAELITHGKFPSMMPRRPPRHASIGEVYDPEKTISWPMAILLGISVGAFISFIIVGMSL